MSNYGGTVVNAFSTHDQARAAVNELRDRGFSVEQVGLAGAHEPAGVSPNHGDSRAAEGAATGVLGGAGLGALWGLGIVSGVMPVLGPAIAAGTLASILTSAAAGATVAGLTGALVGMGIPKEDADYYESELHSGRVILSVTAPNREAEAMEIMARHGGYSRLTKVSTRRETL